MTKVYIMTAKTCTEKIGSLVEGSSEGSSLHENDQLTSGRFQSARMMSSPSSIVASVIRAHWVSTLWCVVVEVGVEVLVEVLVESCVC